MLDINEFAKEVHQNAKDHGWYDEKISIPEVIATMHSELSEALEEYRKGKANAYYIKNPPENALLPVSVVLPLTDPNYSGEKPEGIAVELCDCVIRILDTLADMGVDIEQILTLKHEYNKTRPYKHGGKRI